MLTGLTWHRTANSGRLLRAELTTGSCPDSSAPMYPAIKDGKCRNNNKSLVDTWQDDPPAVGSLLQVLEQEAVGGGPH